MMMVDCWVLHGFMYSLVSHGFLGSTLGGGWADRADPAQEHISPWISTGPLISWITVSRRWWKPCLWTFWRLLWRNSSNRLRKGQKGQSENGRSLSAASEFCSPGWMQPGEISCCLKHWLTGLAQFVIPLRLETRQKAEWGATYGLVM